MDVGILKTVKTREEKDTMGIMRIPEGALYGASTQRAVENFNISGHKMPLEFIHTMGLVKYACAKANGDMNHFSRDKAKWIMKAALEVYEGKLDEHFPLDVFQTGSATSSNMNINEVIANRVSQLAGEPIGSKKPVHPNDDVNMGQSSNDTMPTVLHISVAMALRDELKPALHSFAKELGKKAKAWKKIVKIGRTHLMDATPLTLGQVFSGYATQAKKAIKRVDSGIKALNELALGGTAVGTRINCAKGFPTKVIEAINEKTGMQFQEAENHFEAQAARDDAVEVAGYLNAIAVSVTKIASDIRLLGSGPRSGLYELKLPAVQPGSSIMPGKVNPVMSEMLIQVAMYVMGLCQTVVIAGKDGHFELNVTIPLMAFALHQSIDSLSKAITAFTERCITGLEANVEQCKKWVDRSLMLATALNPHIGYEKACHVAKKAFDEGKTLKDVLLEEKLMDAKTIDKVLDPLKMIVLEDD